MNEWLVILTPLLMLAVIGGAAAYKYIQVNNARSWRSVPGVVVVSGVEARKVEVSDSSVRRLDGEGTETRNFANVVYEYELFGKKLRHNRVSIGEDAGNFEIEETLKRYPVGTPVTVYYNPKKPQEAVLERDAPKGLFGCVAIFVVVGALVYVGVLWGFQPVFDYLRSFVPRQENSAFVVAITGFGLVWALLLEGMRRAIGRAKAWPVAPGRIETSEVEEFTGTIGDKSDRLQTLYRSNIVYSYNAGGRSYRGTSLGSHGTVTANYEGPARRAVARYKVGDAVKVHYDPKNPSESVVDPRTPMMLWFFALVPIGCFVGAYFAGR